MLAQNPIISGFAPDPSVTRIQDTFFLINSSFHLFPGIPIYASTDLANWKHVGNAINRPSQLSLGKSRTMIHRGGEIILVGAGGLWAPTIRHHKGITYIICTNVIHSKADGVDGVDGEPVWPSFENFIIRTTDIWSGEWSDPLFFDFNGIDPDLFFDDDGQVYVTGSSWNTNPGTINGFKIDLQNGAKLTEETVVWEGVIKFIPEGPHIYKKNGHYFLFIAEGGTHDNHQMSIARSENPLGPYESCERNPVLKPTAGLHTQVVFTGHGDLFQDAASRWWLTCLGVRKTEFGNSIMGRETFLTPVKWTNDDGDPWPLIEQPITTTVCLPDTLDSHTLSPSDNASIALQTDLDSVWTRNPDMAAYRTSWVDCLVSLKPSSTNMQGDGTEPVTFIGKRQRQLAGEARAVLSIAPLQNKHVLSGLVYYKDEHRHATVAFDSGAQTIVFEIVNRGKREPVLIRETIYNSREDTKHGSYTAVEFRLVYDEKGLDFFYRFRTASEGSGESWVSAGSVETLAMTDHDFTGPCIGLFSTLTSASTELSSTEETWCDFSEVSLVA